MFKGSWTWSTVGLQLKENAINITLQLCRPLNWRQNCVFIVPNFCEHSYRITVNYWTTQTCSSTNLWSVSCIQEPNKIESSLWHTVRNKDVVVMAGFSAKVNSATSPRKREWKLPESTKMTNIGQITQQIVYFSTFGKNLPAAGENNKLFFLVLSSCFTYVSTQLARLRYLTDFMQYLVF